MKINEHMNERELSERMGYMASFEEAKRMKSLLCANYCGQDTNDVPDGEWEHMDNYATK